MDLKATLSEKKPLQRNRGYRNDVDAEAINAKLCRLCSFSIGLSLFLTLTILMLVPGQDTSDLPTSGSSNVYYESNEPARKYAAPYGLDYTRRETLNFDADIPGTNPGSIGISESLNSCHYRWNASGQVVFARGDIRQQETFIAVADIAASSNMALDSVHLKMRRDTHRLYVDCAEFSRTVHDSAHEDLSEWDAAVDVVVAVLVKPHKLQFGSIIVRTDALDVFIDEHLEFETFRMDIGSSYGNIIGRETETFLAHEMHVHTSNGAITGDWTLPSRVELSTGQFRTAGGPIDINLPPSRISYGPQTQGVLIASSNGGDINIRMPLGNTKLGVRNMTIDIFSESGSIAGNFETGIHAALRTGMNGSINATLLPYFLLPATSTISTSTEAGDTFVHVLPPIINSEYQINPLLDTKSEHISVSGDMDLRYPLEWAGTALGVSDAGEVHIDGEGFDHVLRDEYLAVARRGTGMGSRLDFKTHAGTGRLVLEESQSEVL